MDTFPSSDPYGRASDSKDIVAEDDEEKENDKKKEQKKEEKWFVDKLRRTFQRREQAGLASWIDPGCPSEAPNQRAIAHEDDVCIHALGLPENLTPEIAFAGVFGVIDLPEVWQAPATDIELFVADSQFFHRDQLVPVNLELKGLGVNYHGELQLTADRTEIVRKLRLFQKFEAKLKTALDMAICHGTELSVLVLDSVLSASHGRWALKPNSRENGPSYRHAFHELCRRQHPDLCNSDRRVVPYARRRYEEDEPIIRELQQVPWPLHDWQLDMLEAAGAYLPLTEAVQMVLVNAPKKATESLAGFGEFKNYAKQIAPGSIENITIHHYPYSQPRCVLRDHTVHLAEPQACDFCAASRCRCWIGPALIRVALSVYKNPDSNFEKIFQVYDHARGIQVRNVKTQLAAGGGFSTYREQKSNDDEPSGGSIESPADQDHDMEVHLGKDQGHVSDLLGSTVAVVTVLHLYIH